MTDRETKATRLAQANELIAVIASCGRQFFEYEGRVAAFSLDVRGRLWFTDAYSQKRIYVMSHRHDWRGFSNGGTLRSLIEHLADYIVKADPIWPGFFGYALTRDNHWGYGADMQIVRDAARRIGVIVPEKPADLDAERAAS